MKGPKFLIAALLLIFFAGCNNTPPINVSGTWEGTLTGPGGQLGYRLALVDNGGTLTGNAYMYDATYDIWRHTGPAVGKRNNTQANITNAFIDGSGKLEISGRFQGNSFSGTATAYDQYGAYVGTLDIGLIKK